jgi:hypothetical protein
MIKYSHVSLIIPCDPNAARDITKALSVEPTRVRENRGWQQGSGGRLVETVSHTWMLDSPKGADEATPTGRVEALLRIVEPFGEALLRLDPRFSRCVDILYHVTPQSPHGVLGEFDWFTLPVDLMRRLVNLNLLISYESIWFDHPEWAVPKK